MAKLIFLEHDANFKAPDEHVERLTSQGFKHSKSHQLLYTQHPTAFSVSDSSKSHYKNALNHFKDSGYTRDSRFSTHVNFERKGSGHWVQVVHNRGITSVHFFPEVK